MQTLTFLSTAAAVLALTCAACDSSSIPSPTPPTLGVLSSISNGAVLSNALAWTAVTVGAKAADVARVEFLIDARVRWTAYHPPYVFNGDGDDLFPSVLGPGTHSLAVRVLTRHGTNASTAASVTVSASNPVPSELVGTFARAVTTRSEQVRLTSGTVAASDGRLQLQLSTDGVATVIGPRHDDTDEAFTAFPGGTISFQGSANWLLPTHHGADLCPPETLGAYRWSRRASGLVLSAVHDPCTSRRSILSGDWQHI